ncbi:hypothetical protein KIN20_009630 [Parelaphostrongylus tenuis]|uniref:Uncharacterized protein n=1 Tax=Parelaphostrongylus tenuis TaxID=148309 RepID=A0AAD5QKR7_PARTN|nr:hypothetical protein KIN20_009630 [Parelaphostrongylus tenuis]
MNRVIFISFEGPTSEYLLTYSLFTSAAEWNCLGSKLFVNDYEYKLGSNADAARRISKAWGYRTAGESTVRKRFHEFKAGNEESTDRPISERPTKLDDED